MSILKFIISNVKRINNDSGENSECSALKPPGNQIYKDNDKLNFFVNSINL